MCPAVSLRCPAVRCFGDAGGGGLWAVVVMACSCPSKQEFIPPTNRCVQLSLTSLIDASLEPSSLRLITSVFWVHSRPKADGVPQSAAPAGDGSAANGGANSVSVTKSRSIIVAAAAVVAECLQCLPPRRRRNTTICAHDTVSFRLQASLIHRRRHSGCHHPHTHPAGRPRQDLSG